MTTPQQNTITQKSIEVCQFSTSKRGASNSRKKLRSRQQGLISQIPLPPTRKRVSSRNRCFLQSEVSKLQNQSVQQNYFPKSTIDNEVYSISSAPCAEKEGRQHASSNSHKDLQLRDESPVRKSSCCSSGKSTKVKKEKKIAIRRTIEDINRHLNDGKRKNKLMQACTDFDHWDENLHDIELSKGAANVLALALTMTHDKDEIRIICAALEMVFRATQTAVHTAYLKIGPSVTPWLLQIITRSENGELKNALDNILNITQIFCSWSRVPEVRTLMIQHSGMVEMLARVPNLSVPETKTARMRLISNLVNSNGKDLFFGVIDLLESVLRIAVIDTEDETRKYASIILMDLAACPDNQVTLAKNERVLGALVKLAVKDKTPETREAAIAGLQNLAFCQENRIRLVTFTNGVVLDALKKILSTDNDDKSRRRAAGALTNIACEETAEYMGNHKGLLETLAIVAEGDKRKDVQSRTAMALTKIAAHINKDMSCFKTLLDALVVASLSTESNAVCQVLRAKARYPRNRYCMARHPGILDTLSDICRTKENEKNDKENALRALMHLTNEDLNRKIMCQKTVLNALVTGAGYEGSKWTDLSDSAVIAMERLATEHSNRPIMGRHPGLLSVVAKVTEREQKEEDAGTEAKHERLAKPLLLSLLLAL